MLTSFRVEWRVLDITFCYSSGVVDLSISFVTKFFKWYDKIVYWIFIYCSMDYFVRVIFSIMGLKLGSLISIRNEALEYNLHPERLYSRLWVIANLDVDRILLGQFVGPVLLLAWCFIPCSALVFCGSSFCGWELYCNSDMQMEVHLKCRNYIFISLS